MGLGGGTALGGGWARAVAGTEQAPSRHALNVRPRLTHRSSRVLGQRSLRWTTASHSE